MHSLVGRYPSAVGVLAPFGDLSVVLATWMLVVAVAAVEWVAFAIAAVAVKSDT
jgi:hypothetical protein